MAFTSGKTLSRPPLFGGRTVMSAYLWHTHLPVRLSMTDATAVRGGRTPVPGGCNPRSMRTRGQHYGRPADGLADAIASATAAATTRTPCKQFRVEF